MEAKKDFFAQQLKKAMLEKNINQQALAEKTGVIQQQISFWITGRHKPTLASVKKIADALGVSYTYFLENTEKINGMDEKDIKILQLENKIFKLESELAKKNEEINVLKGNKRLEKTNRKN